MYIDKYEINSPSLHRAVNEQSVLNRIGSDIFVNFSSKFKEVSLPEPGTLNDDGLTKVQLIFF